MMQIVMLVLNGSTMFIVIQIALQSLNLHGPINLTCPKPKHNTHNQS